MRNLIIDGTKETPEIEFADGVFTMSGRSLPEDADYFYKPICQYLEEFVNDNRLMIFNFEMDYYNTMSMRYLSKIFSIINEGYKSGKGVVINWFYRRCDENMQELGEGYKDIYKFKFNIMLR